MSVTARAPAKVNLALVVGGPRPDGFHELATLFHAVGLCDEVVASPTEEPELRVRVEGLVDGVPVDASNLAVRAAAVLREHVGRFDLGANLLVRKQIPVAGGLAGGSADAAAALVACAALWRVRVADDELGGLAARLGSDVPFALRGGTAVGTGRGERLRTVDGAAPLTWVLATAPEGLSTPAVYAELDRQRADVTVPPPVVDEGLVAAVVGADSERIAPLLRNDLEPAALALRPGLGGLLAAGRSAGALAGLVCGSGPTCLFLVGVGDTDRVAAALGRAPEVASVHVVTGPAPGAHVVP